MNSPDTTRLAAALAKLDDPEIITLLLEVVLPKQMRDEPSPPSPTSPRPVQQELLGHIQSRPGGKLDRSHARAGRVWTRAEVATLRAMLNGGSDVDTIAAQMRRSRKSIMEKTRRIQGKRT